MVAGRLVTETTVAALHRQGRLVVDGQPLDRARRAVTGVVGSDAVSIRGTTSTSRSTRTRCPGSTEHWCEPVWTSGDSRGADLIWKTCTWTSLEGPAMWHDVRAEWLTQSSRPAHVALLGLGVTVTVLFGYLVPALGSDNGGVPIQQVQQVPFSGVAIAGLPMVVGGLMVVAGALVVGSEYEWHTWRTILTQRSGRVSVVLAKLVVVAGLAAAATITLLSASAVTTTVIGWASGVAPRWPSAAEV